MSKLRLADFDAPQGFSFDRAFGTSPAHPSGEKSSLRVNNGF